MNIIKKKIYHYKNRVFEVTISNKYCRWLIEIWVYEITRPNRKLFIHKKFLYSQTIDIDNYSSIDEAVRAIVANDLEKEAHDKAIDKKWKEWSNFTLE